MPKDDKKQPEYSPLLFTTTLRSPERIKYFLKVIEKYNDQVLDDNLAIRIMQDCVKEKIYYSVKAFPEFPDYKEAYHSHDEITEDMAKKVVTKIKQDHKQRGFEKGWSSRFKTCFELPRLYGFVWFNEPKYGEEKIKMTNLGKELAKCCEFENIPAPWSAETVSEREQSIFLHASSKYQRNNPFIRSSNKVNPLPLLLKTIRLLNKDKDISSAGISKKELAIFVFWKNNNAQDLYQRIRKLRIDHAFDPSDEIILEICDSLTGGVRQKSRQDKSILSEYPDDFIRKHLITGLISRRGQGRFFDINKKRSDLADYIIKNYSSNRSYTKEKDYFNYASKEDSYLVDYKTQLPETITKDETKNWANELGWDTIKHELMNLKEKKQSKHNIIREVISYVRLEWLITLSLYIKFPNISIKAHLKTDDEGIPYFQAGGNKFDIEIETDDAYSFIEATLITTSNQYPMEINKIPRKIKNFVFNDESKDQKTYFIAPEIHEDSITGVEWLRDKKAIHVENYDIEQFIEKLETSGLTF